MENTLPLLSDSLLKDLKSIAETTKCVVSKALIVAHETGNSTVGDYCRMVSARGGVNANDEDAIEDGSLVMFSFLPKGKDPEYSSNGKWARTGRQVAKPAKVAFSLLEHDVKSADISQLKISNRWYDYDQAAQVAFIFGKSDSVKSITPDEAKGYPARVLKREFTRFSASEYETFTNNVRSFYDCNIEFQLVDGTDIGKYYHYEQYYEGKGQQGTLWNSCMRDVPSKYFEIYEDTPGCKLLVAFFCGKVIGRALVWETKEHGTFMDRIYFYLEHIKEKFISYAKDQKWNYKQNPNSDASSNVMMYDSATDDYISTSNVIMKVSIKGEYGHYPYVDTLKCLILKESVLTNNVDGDYDYLLEDTGGSYNDDERVTCYISGRRYDSDQCIYVDDIDEYVYHDYVVYTYNDSAILERDAVILSDGSYASIYDDNVVTTVCGDKVISDDVNYIERLDSYAYPHQTVTLFNGDFALKSDPGVILTECGKYAYIDDVSVIINKNNTYSLV